MRKHRRNRTTIINPEINYERLAEAITKAQQLSDENRSSMYLTKTFALMISLLFRAISIIAAPLSIMFGIWVYYEIISMLPSTGVMANIVLLISFMVPLVVSFILGLFAVLFWRAATEIKNEKDKNYVVSVFSGLISYAALIVAIVALLKGVG